MPNSSDFTPFFSHLHWGELCHAGNHTIKGNGLFSIHPIAHRTALTSRYASLSIPASRSMSFPLTTIAPLQTPIIEDSGAFVGKQSERLRMTLKGEVKSEAPLLVCLR
ncbi:MAG: hypothetical protein C0183_18065 [Roseiflexus castenholzii]|nr:MAG: hypothetical protein C0183_18065 [Roseiflexus castenholzii]